MGLANWTTVPVHGRYVDSDGDPIAGTVKFTPAPSRLVDSVLATAIIPNAVEVTLDGNGEFTVNLPCTDDPDIAPTGWTYAVVENFTGGQSYSISVPSSMADDGIELIVVSHVSPDVGLTSSITVTDFNNLVADVNSLTAQFRGGTAWTAYTPGLPLDGGFA